MQFRRLWPPLVLICLHAIACQGLKYQNSGDFSDFCINGHVAPKFFLLGAQKSATTNFAFRLGDVGANIAWAQPGPEEPSFFWKEPHIFNQENYRGLTKDQWLAYYPKCNASQNMIAVDATPAYLASYEAPERILSWYGHEVSEKIEFLILLRDPLERMHSSFHHQKNQPSSPWASMSFAQYVDRVLANYESHGCLTGNVFLEDDNYHCSHSDASNDPLYLSMYAANLWPWFRFFRPTQFVVAPFRQYVTPKEGTPRLMEYEAKRVGVRIKPGSHMSAIPKSSKSAGLIRAYPGLEEELAMIETAKVEKLQAVIERYAGAHLLAELLGQRMKQGLVLFGFEGDPSNTSAVAEYLSENW
ncbi:unnamed protein product [Effrenium voratum]|uniref:Sulfotransferase n=2 Tax=Effrenium voratum TaxID=2562239 RepID=A0AA36ILM2_9DINO|nr:unnamed protein product [Effrenium voratum]